MDTSVKTKTQLAQLDRALDAGTLADVAGIIRDSLSGCIRLVGEYDGTEGAGFRCRQAFSRVRQSGH